MNASAPAGSVMHVPYALEFRIKRVFPARSSAVIALAMLKGSCFSPCAAVQRKASNLLAFPKGCSPAIAEASYEMAPEPKKSLLLGLRTECSVCCQDCELYIPGDCGTDCRCYVSLPPQKNSNAIFLYSCSDGFQACCACCSSA